MSPGRPPAHPENVGNVWSRCITVLIGFGVRSATSGLLGPASRVLALGIQRDETEAIAGPDWTNHRSRKVFCPQSRVTSGHCGDAAGRVPYSPDGQQSPYQTRPAHGM